ncbi:hypothetical protein TeGR_g5827, partial [Tetraparma gracilis]
AANPAPAPDSGLTFADTNEAAAAAATFTGGFEPAPTTGGGMGSASKAGVLSQFSQAQEQCGIIYTPPQYSDHLAVTAIFQFPPAFFPSGADAKLKGSAATQPHLAQKTLFDAFGGGGGAKKKSSVFASSTNTNAAKPKAAPSSFFSSSSAAATSTKKKPPPSSFFTSAKVPSKKAKKK